MLTPETCSPDTATLWGFLPQFVQDQDAQNGYPFLTWLEGAGSQLQATDTLARDSGNNPGWSIILDVTRCPTADLPWLAQFVGVRFNSMQTTDAEMRAAITNEQGFNRGTVAAVLAATAPYVTSTSDVTITERDGDAYTVGVSIPSADVPGYLFYYQLPTGHANYTALDGAYATYADMTSSSTNLEAALLNALPAGLILDLTIS